MTFPEYITGFRQNLFCRMANSRFLYITIKNPDTWRYPDYIVAGCPCRDLASDNYSAAGASAAGAASAAFFELRRVVFLAAFGAAARAASLKSTSSMRAMSAPSP